MAWQLSGEKPDVLLLHGMSDSAACWDPLVPFFRSYGGVLAIDARGHGRSGLPDEPLTDAGLASDAAMVLDSLKAGPVVVVGHSIGAVTAAHLCRIRPDLVSAAVLEDPPLFGREPLPAGGPAPDWLTTLRALGLQATLDRGRTDNPSWPADELLPWAKSKHDLNPDFFSRPTKAAPPLIEVLAEVRCPMLLIHGDVERGSLVTADYAAGCKRRAGGPMTVVHIDGVGHSVHREARDRYTSAVSDFLTTRKREPQASDSTDNR